MVSADDWLYRAGPSEALGAVRSLNASRNCSQHVVSIATKNCAENRAHEPALQIPDFKARYSRPSSVETTSRATLRNREHELVHRLRLDGAERRVRRQDTAERLESMVFDEEERSRV